MYNILDFAVHSDSTIVWTRQIQAAIDHVAKLGGGTIYFPAGQYITGTVFLKSHVTLYLDAGCTILGSTDWHDYSTVLDHKCEFPANWRGFGCEPVGNPIYDEENKDEKSRFRALIAAQELLDRAPLMDKLSLVSRYHIRIILKESAPIYSLRISVKESESGVYPLRIQAFGLFPVTRAEIS